MRIWTSVLVLAWVMGCSKSPERFTLADGESHKTADGVTITYGGHHKQNMLTNEIVATTSITLTKGEEEEYVSMVGDDRAEQRVFGRTITVKRLPDEKVEIIWGAD